MRTPLLLVALLAAGCETEGEDVMATITGQVRALDLAEAALPGEDVEETLSWHAAVVGVRPNHHHLGYLETRAWTPARTRVPVVIRYVWPLDLSGPLGFITDTGFAYRFPLPQEDDSQQLAPAGVEWRARRTEPERLGRLPLEAAVLYLLRAPTDGGKTLDPEIVEAQARVDLQTRYVSDYHRLLGNASQVQLEELTAAAMQASMAPKKPAAPAAPAAPPAGGDAPADPG